MTEPVKTGILQPLPNQDLFNLFRRANVTGEDLIKRIEGIRDEMLRGAELYSAKGEHGIAANVAFHAGQLSGVLELYARGKLVLEVKRPEPGIEHQWKTACPQCGMSIQLILKEGP